MDEKEKKDKRNEEEPASVDVGVNLGGIFKGVGDLIDLASKISEGEVQTQKQTKGVYGFSVKVGGVGRPLTVDRFGTLEKGQGHEEVREPLVDVFERESEVVVIAEVPGIEEKDVTIEVQGTELRISAEGKNRTYDKKIELPAEVKEDSHLTCKNGVLEIKLKKA